ncbi:MAG TPA: PLP-dependent aminotransferase family protein [Gaiellaceae bacterium]|nr:PLP-dependent aminotransferase family protein [Gaiellaceae bacterium]
MSPRQLQTRDLLVCVDRSVRVPVGRQLEDQLRAAIRSGALPPGADLPSTRALAGEIGVSRGVVVRAYAQLSAAGYLDLRQGANPRVRKLPDVERVWTVPRQPPATPRIRFDLRPHLPEVTAFPRQAWLRCIRDSLVQATNAELGYIEPRGLESLRVEVANYLARARGVVADPELIVVTGGATHGLSLVARALGARGSVRMAFENPSHFVLHAVATQGGQTPVPVPVDDDGLVVERIGEADSVVVSPAHQFPTGVVLSPERRAELVQWARERSALVVEDDYDAEFRYDRAPVAALQGLCPDRVAYIGSTGKTLVPAIRLGWLVLPPDLVEPVSEELWRTMLHLPGLDQLAFATFLRQGEFDRHLRRMRGIYRTRRDIVVAELERLLPELRVSGIAAGLHVVLELPCTGMEAEVRRRARERGVDVQSVEQHSLPGYDGVAGLLIGYGAVPEPTLPAALEQLALAIRDCGATGDLVARVA